MEVLGDNETYILKLEGEIESLTADRHNYRQAWEAVATSYNIVLADKQKLMKELTAERVRREAAEKRFGAAEEVIEIKNEYYLKINDLDNGELSDMEHKIYKAFKRWQQSIAAYDKAIRGK